MAHGLFLLGRFGAVGSTLEFSAETLLIQPGRFDAVFGHLVDNAVEEPVGNDGQDKDNGDANRALDKPALHLLVIPKTGHGVDGRVLGGSG